MDAGNIGVADALLLEPVDPPRVRLPRAKSADIETVAGQRVQQRGIVDLRIVGERDKCGVTVDAERRQRLVRPFGDDFDVRKTLGRRKCGARIDDGDVIVQQLCDRCERLADVHGAGDDELRRRHVHSKEHASLRGLLHAAPSAAQALGKLRFERIFANIGGLHQPLLAGGGIGDDDRRAARGALGVEGGEEV